MSQKKNIFASIAILMAAACAACTSAPAAAWCWPTWVEKMRPWSSFKWTRSLAPGTYQPGLLSGGLVIKLQPRK